MSKDNTVYIGKSKDFWARNRRSEGYLLRRRIEQITVSVVRALLMEKQKDGVRLYDFSALPAPNQSKQMWIWFLVPAGTIGLFVIVLFTIRRKKKDG